MNWWTWMVDSQSPLHWYIWGEIKLIIMSEFEMISQPHPVYNKILLFKKPRLSSIALCSMESHIRTEFGASLQYLMMAAHFAQDTVNLEGFAKLFFKR